MAVEARYQPDVEAILAHRHDQGGDYWTTPDKRLLKGASFSAYHSAVMLLELGLDPADPALQGVAELFFEAWRPDGRFAVYPKGGILPCHTAPAASLLCTMGYAEDERLQKTFEYFLETPYKDGGWRCNKFSYGRGPETEHSNAYPTLNALNAFRYSRYLNTEPALDRAVECLLEHWVIKKPTGPCHYGIGTLFMQVEYPFSNYNLFQYLHVLSFYKYAKEDPRFLEALGAFQAKLVEGQVVPERVSPKLEKLAFCRKGQPSELATRRYHEILANLGQAE